jgi:hypothetical protein
LCLFVHNEVGIIRFISKKILCFYVLYSWLPKVFSKVLVFVSVRQHNYLIFVNKFIIFMGFWVHKHIHRNATFWFFSNYYALFSRFCCLLAALWLLVLYLIICEINNCLCLFYFLWINNNKTGIFICLFSLVIFSICFWAHFCIRVGKATLLS